MCYIRILQPLFYGIKHIPHTLKTSHIVSRITDFLILFPCSKINAYFLLSYHRWRHNVENAPFSKTGKSFAFIDGVKYFS